MSKPLGYWKVQDNVVAEVKRVMEQHDLSELPSSRQLNDLGYSSIGAAIRKYYGGFPEFRKLLGEKPARKLMGTWASLDYCTAVARQVMEERGVDQLPSERELRILGYSSLAHAIYDHGGFSTFRKLLGGEPLRNPKNSWKDETFAFEQARKVMEENNLTMLPSSSILTELGFSSLSVAITNYHGGFAEFRKKLGEKKEEKQVKCIDDCVSEARQIIQDHGISLPSHKQLVKMGHRELADAVVAHGGFRKFREFLGEANYRRENGTLKDLQYVIDQVRKVMYEQKLSRLPTNQELRDLGHSSLASAISQYHGGFKELRAKVGEPSARRKSPYADKEYVVTDARKVIEENDLTSFPTHEMLKRLGKSTLSKAILDHGGIDFVKENFPEFTPEARSPGTWQDLEYALEQARMLMEERGLETLPSSEKLNDLGYSSLGQAISNYYGGFHVFRKLLGQQRMKRKMGALKDFDYVLGECRKIMEEQGMTELPSGMKLYERGYSSLAAAITKYHGGFVKIRRILGEKPKKELNGAWKDVSYVLSRVKEVMEKHKLDVLPSEIELA